MKRTLFLLAIFVSGTSSASPSVPPYEWRIAAGRSVGHVRIGADAVASLARFGPADTGDGAAGHSWSTWYTHRETRGMPPGELDVYTTLATGAPGKVINIVRVTSPSFRTRQGIHTGGSLANIRTAFPHIRLIKVFRVRPGAPSTYLYDDVNQGIAFEINHRSVHHRTVTVCTAIAVHRRGVQPTQETMAMPAYLQTIAARHS